MAVLVVPSVGGRIASIALHSGRNVLVPDTARAGRLERFHGGWQCMFPNAGAASVHAGIAHLAHGAAFAGPWTVQVEDRSSLELEIRVPGDLQLRRRIELDGSRPALSVRDRVLNVGEHARSFSFGHHPVFAGRGDQVLELPPGTKLVSAPEDGKDYPVEVRERTSWRVENLLGARREAFWVLECPEAGWAHLRAASIESKGVGTSTSMSWDARALRYLWLWLRKQPRRRDGSDVISIGIEPVSSSSPTGLADAAGRGEDLTLAPAQDRTFELDLELNADLPHGPGIIGDRASSDADMARRLPLLDEFAEATYRGRSID